MLTFDKAKHEYRWNGIVVPSVSNIIEGARDLAGIPAGVLQAAAERGEDVHFATTLDDDGTLDEGTITAEVAPYLDAYRLFKQEHQPVWHASENPMYHKLLRYAGTPDRVGFIGDEFSVVELKSTVQLHRAFGLQLTGYANIVEALDGVRPKRLVVQLLRTGKYVLQEYTDETDTIVFRSMINILNWSKRYV